MKRLLTSLVGLVTGLAALGATRLLGPRKGAAPARVAPTEPPEPQHRWKRLAKHFALFAVVLAVGGFLVAASGLIPIKASSGHFAVTRWLLEFSKQRAFATQSMSVTVPPLDSLDNPALVLKGAGHYDYGCRPCHGSPDLHHPDVTQGMTPSPPYLPTALPAWEPEELFSIVKHGIKFAGMPAWPAQKRDDEVWAMVAFLRAFEDLDAAAYRQLVEGGVAEGIETPPLTGLVEPDVVQETEEVPRIVVESCGRCHGVDGLGRGLGAFPKLAGQRPAYLYASLVAYAREERHSGIMQPLAAGLNPDEMRLLARYYANLEAPPTLLPAHRPSVERGAIIAHEGIPEEGIPACVDCHGPTEHPRNPFYPTLAGQYADYTVLQLQLFAHGHRGGSPYARLMHPTADRLMPEQRRAVARYYESLAADADVSRVVDERMP